MTINKDFLTTALAPMIWGSSYVVVTQLVPHGEPLSVSLMRALPAGLILLAIARQLPTGIWWIRAAILGAFNFSIFWGLMFYSAYQLPGGVAATVAALQPLFVVFLARAIMGTAIRKRAILAALIGIAGVCALILTPETPLDPLGLAAGLGAAISMAAGMVLSRHWQPPVSTLTFTAWQLTAGGILLIPAVLLLEPQFMPLDGRAMLGLGFLSLVGGAFTYWLYLRGVARIAPSALSLLAFFSPLTAVILGWVLLGQNLTPIQIIGALLVIFGVWLGQRK